MAHQKNQWVALGVVMAIVSVVGFYLYAARETGWNHGYGVDDSPPIKVFHVKNWHWISKEDFRADQRDLDPEVTEAAIDARYAIFLDDIEELQREQEAVVLELMKEHGIRGVFYEGITNENVEQFRSVIAEFCRTRDVLASVESMEKNALTDEDRMAANRLKVEVNRIYAEQRQTRLMGGCILRLIESGEPLEVLPLEATGPLDAANPVAADGTINFDKKADLAREDEMAKRVLSSGPVAIVILGGAHDMSDNLKKLSHSAIYETSETPKYKKLAY